MQLLGHRIHSIVLFSMRCLHTSLFLLALSWLSQYSEFIVPVVYETFTVIVDLYSSNEHLSVGFVISFSLNSCFVNYLSVSKKIANFHTFFALNTLFQASFFHNLGSIHVHQSQNDLFQLLSTRSIQMNIINIAWNSPQISQCDSNCYQ